MRNFDDPQYVEWRKAVFTRDGFKCQMDGCKGKRIQAHHILRWVDAPQLRYDVSNGITLCNYHHKVVTGNEQTYAAHFQHVVSTKTIDIKADEFFDLQRKLYGEDN